MEGPTPHSRTPAEIKEELAAEAAGRPFLIVRSTAAQRVVALEDAAGRLTVGRDPGSAVSLEDPRVSRLHAVLEPVEGHWVLEDDGLSTNGTRVNGEPLLRRRRLRDGDVVAIGDHRLVFRDPAAMPAVVTEYVEPGDAPPALEPVDRGILVALCAPRLANPYAGLPTNRDIAGVVHLSESRVKARLGVLYDRLGVEPELGHNQKRARLAEVAVRTGLVGPDDL